MANKILKRIEDLQEFLIDGVSVNDLTIVSRNGVPFKLKLMDMLELTNGSPKGVFDDIDDLNDADPNHMYIYLLDNNGHWAYYDSDAGVFVDSGYMYSDSIAYSDLAGVGRTTETVKENADNIESNTENIIKNIEDIYTNEKNIINTIRKQNMILTENITLVPSQVNYSMIEATVGVDVTVTIDEGAEWVIFD